jgi:phytoene desaturase
MRSEFTSAGGQVAGQVPGGGTASAPPATRTGHRPAQALVIGSGFGGLAAAIRLALRGYAVTVLEKLDGPGGRAYVWHQDGFSFDAGPTIITVPWLFEELWKMAGRNFHDDVKMVLMDPYYRIRYPDGTHFDYHGDHDRMRAEIARIDPADLAGYDRFVAHADKCYDLGFLQLGSIAYETVGDLTRAIPKLARMKAWQTMYGLVSQHIKHPKLRIALSLQTLLIGGNPFAVTGVYSLINALERKFGVYSAIGGTGAIVKAMANLLTDLGGQIRYESEVRRIVVDQGRATGVELASGERLAADLIVNNGDASWTYKHLVDAEHRSHWTDRKIARGKYSMSLFLWYFGTNRQYPQVPHHTMVLGPRYKGLLDDIFKHHHLADDFSLYLHRPTATDPSVAPAGCDTFYVLSPVPHLDSGTDWREHAANYRQAVQRRLEETMLPDLGRHVISSRVTTPADFETRLNSYKGAAFGLEPLLLQSAYFRPHNRSQDVDRLFHVGASTHPGAGVPGALMSARALDTVLPMPAQVLQA